MAWIFAGIRFWLSTGFWCPKTYPEVYTPYRGCDALLYRLKRSDVAELRSVYNEYFYARALREGPSAADVAILEENGWTDFKGFVEKGCERFKETAWAYRVRELIRALPISRGAAAKGAGGSERSVGLGRKLMEAA